MQSMTVPDPLEVGVNAYGRGEYVDAYRLLLPRAESGDADAQYHIGRMLYYGHGIDQSAVAAAAFFKKAAESGHVRAQCFLGFMYREGLKTAASRGDRRAMAFLGHMHIYGVGVRKDYARAFEYSYQAHRLGDPYGTVNLGWFYEYGFVAKKNLERARRFYESAARRGVAHAFHNLGVLYLHGIGVTRDEKKARQLLQQAAADGDQEAVDLLCHLDPRSPK